MHKQILNLLAIAILFTFISSSLSAAVKEITIFKPEKTYAVSNTGQRVSLALNYPEAFMIEILAYVDKSKNGQQRFCNAAPSRIVSNPEWTIEYPFENSQNYDNILYDGEYYYLLDSTDLHILVVKNFTDVESMHKIESEKGNTAGVNGVYEVPWFLLDSRKEYLYIVTDDFVLSYQLSLSKTAIEQGNAIPKINVQAFGESSPKHGFKSISSVQFHNDHLYLAADNNIHIYTASGGTLARTATIDSQYVDTEEVNFIDMTFRGTTLFALDSLRGVMTFDISNTQAIHTQGAKIEIDGAQYVEIVGDSLNIISSETKNSFMYEYIITSESKNGPILVSNREIELIQSVRDVYSDNKFLYLLTGFINTAYKHSIPGKYETQDVPYLENDWIFFDSKAMIPVDRGNDTTVIALSDDYIENFTFYMSDPSLDCLLTNVSEGEYEFTFKAYQRTCPQKENSTNVDYNTICITKEAITMIVGTDNSNIGDTTINEILAKGLAGGLLAMFLLCVIFCCLYRKHKKQFLKLEDQIKFIKLKEEGDGGDAQSPTKQSGNVQVNVDNDDKFKKQSEIPQNREEEEKKEDHHGEIKALDIEGIYGQVGKGKGGDDDDDLE